MICLFQWVTLTLDYTDCVLTVINKNFTIGLSTQYTYSTVTGSSSSKKFKATSFRNLTRILHVTGYEDENNMDLKRIITTIPGNLNLSEAEKPILHKGLNFILIKPTTNEFTTKDCEKFFRWLQLKAFFQNQNKENDGPVDDPGATSDNRERNEPTSTPETIKSLSNRSQSNLSGYPHPVNSPPETISFTVVKLKLTASILATRQLYKISQKRKEMR